VAEENPLSGATFDHLGWWWLFWLVAGAIALGIYGLFARRASLKRLADARLLPALAPLGVIAGAAVRLGLVAAALALLCVALLGPRWGEVTDRVFRRNIDVIVLLDVSRSMLARDIAPNRLERAKLSIIDDLIPALAGDRIGVIAFAGVPRLVCPLTDDYGFLRLALADVDPLSVPRGGSLIGDALRAAGDAFPKRLDTEKLVLLVTDGEDQESFPVEAAQKLWDERRITVVPIALGDDREGARIPVNEEGTRFLQHDGDTVWSRADFQILRRIAAISPLNAFVGVGTKDFNLGEIYRTRIVPGIRAREDLVERTTKRPAQYHWFAGAALLLLLVESFMREGRRPPIRAASRMRIAPADNARTKSPAVTS
jgi:Ca-activated chloride channel family protein